MLWGSSLDDRTFGWQPRTTYYYQIETVDATDQRARTTVASFETGSDPLYEQPDEEIDSQNFNDINYKQMAKA